MTPPGFGASPVIISIMLSSHPPALSLRPVATSVRAHSTHSRISPTLMESHALLLLPPRPRMPPPAWAARYGRPLLHTGSTQKKSPPTPRTSLARSQRAVGYFVRPPFLPLRASHASHAIWPPLICGLRPRPPASARDHARISPHARSARFGCIWLWLAGVRGFVASM